MTKEQFEVIKMALNGNGNRTWHDKWYVELSQALTELYESSLWQPIETAPDQVYMLTWCDDDHKILMLDAQTGKWWDEDSHGWQPTRWQPLPEAPK